MPTTITFNADDSLAETPYTLIDPELKDYTLTPQEAAALGKTQLKNYEKALAGDPKALNVMGTYYESGNAVPKDYILRIAERLSARQIKYAQQEAERKFSAIQQNTN